MNHIYRLKRTGRSQQVQPVPETARSASKGLRTGKTLAQTVSTTVASVALAGVASLAHAQQAPPASAPTATQLPQGGVVTRGSANIVTNTGSNAGNAQLTVNQTSSRAVIDWASFNVGSQAKVQFNQPGASAVTLNNILGNNASQIYGQISANGQVFLSNPNGIYFSPTAQVDVGGLVATTGKANADDFMAGKASFNRDGSTGSVVNQGQLKAALGGYIALLAPEVRNQGVVIAQAGTVALASGEVITLSFNQSGTGLAGLVTTPQAIAALVDNQSAVLAEGGQIILSAHALASLQGAVVNNSGQLSASSLTEKGGKIVLMADKVALTSTSKMEANGATGGGTVLVGGDWQGSAGTRQATQVTMAQGASIEANATQQGDGGKVVLWSDVHNASSLTQVDGRIEAKGAGAGNGGQVETSGHLLRVGDAARVTTDGGQWLLDPYDFTVAATGGNITGAQLSTALESGSVTISSGATASASGGGLSVNSTTSGSGDINIKDPVSWLASNTLTLSAGRNIYIAAPISATGTSAGLNIFYGGSNATTAPTVTGSFYQFDLTNPGTNFINLPGSSASLNIAGRNYTLLRTLSDIRGMTANGTYALVKSLDTPVAYDNAVFTGNFTGVFDGLGNSVSGIQLVNNCTATCNIGFFAQASGGAQIKNLQVYELFTLTGPATGTATYTNYAVGGLIGRVSGGTAAATNTFTGNVVTFVQNTSNASGLTINGYWAGGLIGQVYAPTGANVYMQVSQSVATVNINNTATAAINGSSVGGIVGDVGASVGSSPVQGSGGTVNIDTTYISGSINVRQTSGYWGVGGLLGQSYGVTPTISNSFTYFVSGALTSTGGTISVNGLAGWTSPSVSMSNSYSTYPGTNSGTNYYGVSLTGNTSLLAGFSSNYWQITNGTIVLKSLPVPSAAPGIPIYVQANQTSGTYGGLNITYSLYDPSLTGITLGSGAYANVGIGGVASYNLGNTTDAGTYSIKYTSGLYLTGTNAAAYTLYTYPRTFTIGKAPLQVIANNDSKFENQLDATGYAGVSYSGFVNGQTSSVLGGTLQIVRSTSGPDGNLGLSNNTVGSYSGVLTPSGLSANNYAINYVPGNYSVIPGNQLLVRVSTQSSPYGSAPTYSLSSVQYYDTGSSSVVTVSPSNITITGSQVSVNDGSGGSQQFSLTPQVNGQAATYSTSSSLKVGAYQMAANHVTSTNTIFSSTPSVTGSLTVTPVALTPSISQGASKTYDGSTGVNFNNVGFSLAGLVNGDLVNVTGNGSYASKNANTGLSYTLADLKLAGADSSNYYLAASVGKLTANNGTITQASLGISAAATYAGSTTVTPSSVTLTGLLGEDVNATVSSLVANNQNVASANKVNSLVLSNGAQGNYLLNAAVNTNAATTTTNTLSLNKAPLGVSLTATYSGSTTLTGSPVLTGLVGGDTSATATSVVSSSKDVATASKRVVSLVLSNGNEVNYQLNASSNTTTGTNTTNTVTINVKPLTVSGLSLTSTSKVYDGNTSAAFTATPALLTDEAVGTGSTSDGKSYTGDVVTLSGSVTSATYSSKNVGTGLTVTYNGLSINNSNYSLAATTTANITARPLTISGTTATKIYNGQTSVTVTPGTLSGLLGSETLTVTGTGTFSSANVGNYTFTPTYTLSNGTNGGLATNYALTASSVSGSITPKALTVSGLTVVATKVYDGTTVASVSGTPTFLASEAAGAGSGTDGKPYTGTTWTTYTGTASGTYSSKNVGTALSVALGGLISGNSNYTFSIANQTANITQADLQVSGVAASSKVYDANTTATLTGAATVTALGSDVVTVTGSGLGSFVDKNVGTGKAVTVTGYTLTGTDAGNYRVVQPTGLRANITPADLVVTGLSVANKVYDGHSTATLTGTAAVTGLGSDVVSVSGTGTAAFSDKNVGASKTVMVTGYSLSGADAGNYQLAQSLGVRASITAAPLSVTLTAIDKVYDGTTAVNFSSTDNRFSGDVLTVSGIGSFADKNVGAAKTVSLAGVSLSGTDALNYTVSSSTLTQPIANITRLGSATWVGGANGDWFNPANWAPTNNLSATGAVPDLSNVASVVIPAGKMVNFSSSVVGAAQSGTVNIDSLSGAGSVSMTAGALSVGTGGVSLASLTQTGGMLTFTGNSSLTTSGSVTLATLSAAGSLDVISGADATVTGNISMGNSPLLIKAAGNIFQNSSTTVLSTGGNITYWADSGANGAGAITLNAGTSATANAKVSAGAGDIVFGGGNGVSAARGPAVGIKGVQLGNYANLSGANITLIGRGAAGSGSTTGVDIGDFASVSATGAVAITGTGGGSAVLSSTNNIGINLGAATVESTGSGAVTMIGTGGGAASGSGSGNYGIAIAGGTGNVYSTVRTASGALTLVATSGTGGYLNTGYLPIGNVRLGGVSETGSVTVQASNMQLDAWTGINNIQTTGAVTLEPLASSTSFTSALGPRFSWGPGISSVTIGRLGNTTSVDWFSPASIQGPVSIYGDTAFYASLTATGAVSINGALSTAGSAVKLTAPSLLVTGTGASNVTISTDISTFAGSGLGVVTLSNQGALTIGTLSGVSGISSSGYINIATQTGDITVAGNVTTTSSSGPGAALILNAGQSKSALDGTGGNVVISGSPGITVGALGNAILYTGSVADSTGLSSLIGSGTGHFRYGSDEITKNYTTQLGTGVYAIYREQPSVSWSAAGDQSLLYGQAFTYSTTGNLATYSATGSYSSGLQNGDEVKVSQSVLLRNATTKAVAGPNSTSGLYDVGVYEVSKTASAEALGYAGVNPRIAVTQAPLVITANDVTKTYDAGAYASSGFAGLTYSGLLGADKSTVVGILNSALPIWGGTAQYAVNAGTYSIAVSNLKAANYSISYVPGTLTVNPKPLTIRVNDDARFVTQSDTAGYAGASYTGFVSGQSIATLGTLSITRSGGATAPGTYSGVLQASISGLTNTNYLIAYVPGNYTIVPADQLLVKVANQSVTYGTDPSNYTITSAQYLKSSSSTLIDLTSRVTMAGTVLSLNDGDGGSTSLVIGPTNTTLSSAGKVNAYGGYQLEASSILNSSANYKNTITMTGALTVKPQAVTVSATGGFSKTYDGSASMPGLVLALSGAQSADKVSVSGSAAYGGVDVGTTAYAVNNLVLGGLDKGNYVLGAGNSMSGSNAAITPAALTVTAQSERKTYDGLAYQGGNGVVFSGFVNNETNAVLGGALSYAGTSQGAINAGSYVITPQGLSSNNYTITYVNASLTVDPVTISTSALNGVLKGPVSKVYDGNNTATLTDANYVLTGWIGTDSASVTKTSGTYDTANVGTGKLVIVSLTSADYQAGGSTNLANYVLPSTITGAVGTITARPVTVSGLMAASKTYDGNSTVAISNWGAVATGVANESLTLVPGSASFADASAQQGKTVTATGYSLADGTGGLASNYVLTSGTSTTTANIDAKNVTVAGVARRTIYDAVSTYADLGNNTGFVTSALAPGDWVASVSKALSGSGVMPNAVAQAGAYTVTPSTAVMGQGTAGNYNFSYAAANNTVDKANLALTATASLTGNVYNGNAYTGTYTMNALGNDASGITVTGMATGTNAGTYTSSLQVSGAVLANYNAPVITEASLVVSPKAVTVSNTSRSTTYDGVTSYGSLATGTAFTATLVGSDSMASVTQTASGTGVTSSGVAQAGSFTVTPSHAVMGTGLASNYDFSYVASTHTVDKANLAIAATASLTGNVYNGTAYTGTYTSTALGNDASSMTVTGVATGTNAGTYASNLAVSGAVLTNYNAPVVTNANLVVSAKPVTVTSATGNTTYDAVTTYGALTTATGFSTSPMVGLDSVASVTQTASGAGVTASGVAQAGSFTVTPSSAAMGTGLASNYSFSYAPSTYSVAKANLALTAVASLTGNVYNGTAYTGTYTSNALGSDASGMTVTGVATGTNAGTYTSSLAVSGAVLTNYNAPVVTNANLVVSPKAVTVSNTSRSTTYDGASSYATLANGTAFTASPLVGSDAVASVTQTPSGTGVTPSGVAQAGSFTVTPSAAVMGTGLAGNYSFSYVPSTHTVAMASLGVSISGALQGTVSKTYDGSTAATLTSGNYRLTGWLGADGATVTQTSGSYDSATAGSGKTVTVTLGNSDYVANSGTNLANYRLPTLISGAVGQISKANATVTANSGTLSYNGTNQTVSGFTATGLVNNEAPSVLTGVTASNTYKNAGTYATTASGTDSNYNLTFAPGSMVINKAVLTATGNSAQVTYSGGNQSVSGFTVNGLLGTDTVGNLTSISAAGATGKNAGSYTNIVTAGTEANYTVSTVNGSLAIAKANATVTANGGMLTYNGANQNVSGFTASGLVGGETAAVLTGVTASTTQKNAGTYATTASGNDGNYNLSFVPGSMVIQKAALTVQANNDAKFVTQADVSGYAGVSYSGWVGGETALTAGLGGTLAVTRSSSGPDGNTGASNALAGSYTGALTASGLSSGNYAISYLPGNYTIVPANQLLVRLTPTSANYGSAATYSVAEAKYLNQNSNTIVDLTGSVSRSGNSFTVSDGVGGSASFTVSPVGAVTSGAGQLAAGSYQLGATGTHVVSNNFSNTLTLVGTQSVMATPVTAVPLVSKVYDGTTAIAHQAVPVNGALSGDVVDAAGHGAFASKNVGSNLGYSMSGLVLSGTDAGNYYLAGASSVSGSNGSITPAPLNVSFTAASKVYDGNTAATLSSTDNRFGSDALTVLATGNFADKNVGTGKTVTVSGVSLAGADAGNYSISSTGSGPTASIMRLAQVTWVGGATGNWFDPANWAGGAVPDLANVASVTIPAGVTVSFGTAVVAPAQAGAVSLDALGSAGSLSMSGGTLNVGLGGVTLNTLTQTGGNLTSAGPVTLGSLSQTAGSLSAGSLSTTTAYSQTGAGTISVTGPAVISATHGPVVLGNLTTTGSLNVNSTGGAITQTAGTALSVAGTSTLNASANGQPADVLLSNAGNVLAGTVTATGNNVNLNVTGPLTSTVTAAGNATLSSTGDLNASTTANNLTTTSGGNTTLGTTTLTGDLSTNSGGTTTLGATMVGGNMNVNSTGGAITQTAGTALSVAGNSTLSASANGQPADVLLSNAGNVLAGTVTATGNNVNLNVTGPLTANVTAAGDATLSSTGNLNASTTANNLTTTSGGNTTLGTTTLTGNLNTTSGSSTTLGATTVGGNMSVNSFGTVSQTQPVHVDGSSHVTSTQGDVLLNNSGNSFAEPVVAQAVHTVLAGTNATSNPAAAAATVLTPALVNAQAPYAVNVLKSPQASEGVVHLALRNVLSDQQVVLPEMVRDWVAAANGDLRLLGPSGEALEGMALSANGAVLSVKTTAGVRLPDQIVLQSGQGQLVVRLVKAP